jgi:hypothetical protein
MSHRVRVACWIAAILAFAADAGAQTKNRFAVGANFNTTLATEAQNDGGSHVGFQWRLGHSESGWGWKFGFNWYTTEIGATIDGHPVAVGVLHVRPIMVGYGYTRTVRKLAVSTNLLAGFAVNGFSLGDGAAALYRASSGSQQLSTGALNTVALFPEVSVWRDLNERVGFNISGGYMIARPDVSIQTAGGITRHPVRADTVRVKVGIVYSIF